MTLEKTTTPDKVLNQNWDSMLKIFHSIDMDSKDAKEKLTQLKELSATKDMTERQHEGIRDRCNNKINGTYGSTSREVKSQKK